MIPEQILIIKHHAELLLEHSAAAYWSEQHREYLVEQMRKHIKDLEEAIK